MVKNIRVALYFSCVKFYSSAASLACSRSTSNLRNCNPYAASANANIGLRKASNKAKLAAEARKLAKAKLAAAKAKAAASTSTTKASGATVKIVAKKFAPILRQSYKGVKRTAATNSSRVA